MIYLDVGKFSFNDESLKGFIVSKIDNIEVDFYDVEVIFKKSRNIVFNVTISDINLSKYLDKTDDLHSIKGTYYHYIFFATINKHTHVGGHPPFFKYQIVIDLIEFSKKDIFFIESSNKFNLEIIPTNNMIFYMDRFGENDLFIFKNMLYEQYNKKYRYLIELNSFIYKTPILIEKLYFYKDDVSNIVFQSQYINKEIVNQLNEKYYVSINSHFTPNLEKYLNNYLKLKTQNDLVNMLLNLYFIDNMYLGKEHYNLNDISGFIDLFDGIYIILKIKNEKLNNSRTQKDKLSKHCMSSKIEYILEQIEPELKQYEIDNNNCLSKVLSDFRNMVRHQKPFKKFDLKKLLNFSQGVLRLYIIKQILQISDEDYDINRVLSDFNIYPLVKHKYKYKNDEIIIYDTNINIQNRELNKNSVIYQTLISHKQFKDAKPDDFVYDESFTNEIRKLYIDDNNEIRRALIFWGIIVCNETLIQDKNTVYPLTLSYSELMANLLSFPSSPMRMHTVKQPDDIHTTTQEHGSESCFTL